ncbi:MAG TPA: pyruvate kinase, partial [Sphingobacterium sp.]|nr:pyruvate kinase [Sphingobacterium sp.]
TSYRPNVDILVFTGTQKLLKQLSLLWGVKTFIYDKFESTDGSIHDVNKFIVKNNYVKPGSIIINTASTPLIEKGKTNTIRVSQL